MVTLLLTRLFYPNGMKELRKIVSEENGPRPIRVAFKTEVSDSDEARKEIVELVKIARKKGGSSIE